MSISGRLMDDQLESRNHGNPQPSFLGVITGVENLSFFHWFLGSKGSHDFLQQMLCQGDGSRWLIFTGAEPSKISLTIEAAWTCFMQQFHTNLPEPGALNIF